MCAELFVVRERRRRLCIQQHKCCNMVPFHFETFIYPVPGWSQISRTQLRVCFILIMILCMISCSHPPSTGAANSKPSCVILQPSRGAVSRLMESMAADEDFEPNQDSSFSEDELLPQHSNSASERSSTPGQCTQTPSTAPSRRGPHCK